VAAALRYWNRESAKERKSEILQQLGKKHVGWHPYQESRSNYRRLFNKAFAVFRVFALSRFRD
jgi:hypothetical protein